MNTQQIDTFVNNELREYAVYDNIRSIPSLVDGLKTAQRKIIYTVFKTIKPGVNIKTVSLGSAASNLTHYAHGETSITDCVVGLAKDYAGSNNYPLLQKDGQFGTAQNNKSASPRYIHVKRNQKLDDMFDPIDREIIEYLKHDGEEIEPLYFLPKLPLIAINGSNGIGNGYGANILPRKLQDVANYVKAKMRGDTDLPTLIPHFNGFTGEIEKLGPKTFLMKGKFERKSLTQTVVTDLPPDSRYQYDPYKERVLLDLLEKKKITGIDNESNSRNGWKIIIHHPREFGRLKDDKIAEALKLNRQATENLTVWGYDRRIKTFDTIEELIDSWIEGRLPWIQRRKEYKLEKMNIQLNWYKSFVELTRYWLQNPDLLKKKRPDIIEELKAIESDEENIRRFLSSEILSLTEERIEKTIKESEAISKEIEEYSKLTPQQILLDDLNSDLFK